MKIIRVYHLYITLNNKDVLYNEFFKTDSKIRIIIAIESFEIGMDLSDVIQIVQYSFLLKRLLYIFI